MAKQKNVTALNTGTITDDTGSESNTQTQEQTTVTNLEQTSEQSQETTQGGDNNSEGEKTSESETSVTTVPVIIDTTVVQSKVEEVSNLPAKNDFEKTMDDLIENGTLAEKVTIHNLRHYVEKMNVRASQSPESLKENQSKLWGILRTTVEAKDGTFKERWVIILQFFNEYSDNVFSSINVSRGINYVSLPKESLNAFQRLIHLAVGTCNPTLRASALKQISFDTMLKEGLTAVANRNITSFYNI